MPLTLIVLMAYGVYFIPPSALPQQIGLGMTAVLNRWGRWAFSLAMLANFALAFLF